MANRRLVDAAMVAAALVASADGPLGADRRRALERVLRAREHPAGLDDAAAVEQLEAFLDGIDGSGEIGRARALEAVSDVADDAMSARALWHVVTAVAGTIGRGSPRQAAEIRMIASVAGLAMDFASEGDFASAGEAARRAPCVITLGCPKGGTGKSTTAVLIAVALVGQGHEVGCIDLDGRQATLARYLDNRAAYGKASDRDLGRLRLRRVEPSLLRDRDRAEDEERARFHAALSDFADCAYVVIDTPGHECHLARLACVAADRLITPVNDSLVDIDVLAEIDPGKRQALGPSAFCRMIWRENDRRAACGRGTIDWIVMRNRLSHRNAVNTREVSRLLLRLSERIGFRLTPGLSDRVAFRELFLSGLTPLDPPGLEAGCRSRRSLSLARQEIGELLRASGVPDPR